MPIQPHEQLSPQMITAEVSSGMVISAPVDLWVSTLLEIIDNDVRQQWLETIIKKIQDQQARPTLVTPNGRVLQ